MVPRRQNAQPFTSPLRPSIPLKGVFVVDHKSADGEPFPEWSLRWAHLLNDMQQCVACGKFLPKDGDECSKEGQERTRVGEGKDYITYRVRCTSADSNGVQHVNTYTLYIKMR